MSDTNVLERFLKEAADGIERKRRGKPQPLNGQYRNAAWYKFIFSKIDRDEAFEIVSKNIKQKSFSHEPQIAIAEYELAYGCKYQSPAERTIDAQREEVARLRAEIEELKKAKVDAGGNADSGDTFESYDLSFPPGLTQEQFKPIFCDWFEKSQGHKPNGGAQLAGWKNYLKKNEVKV